MRADVEITGIAAGGAGVGRLPDGRAVFVHRTAPGELVEVRVIEEKRRWARAELVRLRRTVPERREAPCPHYTRCGGCTLEHLDYDAQRRIKAGIVSDALRRIGGLEVEPPDVVASPAEFRYRNRVSFTLRRLGGGRVIAGFHEIDRPNRIVDITAACLLPEPAVAEAWGRLRAAWGEDAKLLPSGERLRLTLRGTAGGEVALLVDGGFATGRPEELLERAALAAIWRVGRDGEPELLAGEPTLRERWRDEELELGGAVFLQVNRGAAALLEDHVLALAGASSGEEEAERDGRAPRRVIDAYCGIGLYARRLARSGAEVMGIELDARAVEVARRLAPAGASFVEGRVEERLAEALPADLVIVNPPRAGLDAEVPRILLDAAPRRLIYVSCDPATLARDLERLAPRYRLRSLRCFDLFPQTAHVETVAELECDTL